MPEIRVCISWYYVFLRESILWHCQPAQTLVQQLCSAWTLQLILPLTTGLLWPFYFTFNFSDLLYLIVSSLLLFCFFEMISSAWNIWKRDRPREGAIPRIGHGRFDPTKTLEVHWSFIRGSLSCKMYVANLRTSEAKVNFCINLNSPDHGATSLSENP